MRVNFVLTGEMPLLMHWDNIEGCDLLNEWRKDPANKNRSKAGDDRTPPWTWHTYCYTDGIDITIPSDNLMRAFMYGGTKLILKGKKTYKELSQQGILIDTEFLDFTYDGGKKLTSQQLADIRDVDFAGQQAFAKDNGFKLHVKRVPIGTSKHIRVRPRFETWQLAGSLDVTHQDISFETLREIFYHAGRGGLCDWRPSSPRSPGPFGMFTTELQKV